MEKQHSDHASRDSDTNPRTEERGFPLSSVSDKFPKGKVKVKLHIYEEPDFMPTPFYVTSVKYENTHSPYLGEVEVEFTFPAINSKEERLKQLDKTLEEEKNRHKEAVERLESMKEQLKGDDV